MNRSCAVITIIGLLAAAHAATAGDITGTITFKGTPPKEKDMTPIMENAECKPLHTTMPTTRFYVMGPNGGLADVVVYLEGVPAKSTGATAPPVVLDQKGCLYVPQILALQTGQKLIVKNSDPVLHNVHTEPADGSGNTSFNQAQLAGGSDLTLTFDKPELSLKVKCDVHNWMFAWVNVFDNPCFAVSDKNGMFKIANVPPGKYKLHAEHHKAGKLVQEVEVTDGEPTKVALTFETK
jgi:plastocyanin